MIIEQISPSAYFQSLVFSTHPTAKGDFGIAILAKDLEFKISEANKDINENIKQIYSPSRESVLLAYLAFKAGFIRFKKPLSIAFRVTATRNVNVGEDTVLGDGNNMYYVDKFTFIKANEPTTVRATLKEKTVIEKVLDSGTMFAHIKLDVTYKECVGVRVFNGDEELVHSQNFTSNKAHYSIEFVADSYVQVVLKYSEEVKLGDNIRVEYSTSTDTATAPNGISFLELDDMDIIIEDIIVANSYVSPLSISEMQYLIRFSRANLGDLALNEDFRQLFKAGVPNVAHIKVWQQREEAIVEGFKCQDINRVFMCYLKDDGTDKDIAIEEYIRDVFYSNVYGRYLEIRGTTVVDLEVKISVTTNDIYNPRIVDTIIESLVGYYDNVERVISKTVVMEHALGVLRDNLKLYEANFELSPLGDYSPSKIFRIKKENVRIGFSSYLNEDRRVVI